MAFDYTADEDMLGIGHLDPEQINDLGTPPINFDEVVF